MEEAVVTAEKQLAHYKCDRCRDGATIGLQHRRHRTVRRCQARIKCSCAALVAACARQASK